MRRFVVEAGARDHCEIPRRCKCGDLSHQSTTDSAASSAFLGLKVVDGDHSDP